MRRFFVSFFFLFVAFALTSISFSLAESGGVYEISPDVSLFAVGTGNGMRWNQSTSRFQTQPFANGSWVDTGNFTLQDLFNSYDLATQADVQAASLTVPNVVDALSQYFSTNLAQLGSSGRFATSGGDYLSFTPALQNQLNNLFTTSIGSYSNTYLNSSGVITQNSDSGLYIPLSSLVSMGFAGLGNRLMGPSSSFSWTLRQTGSTSNYTNFTSPNLASVFSQGFRAMQDAFVVPTGAVVLQTDGTVSSPLSVTASNTRIMRDSFLGLATILRGSSGNVASFDILSSSDITSTTPFEANNLLDAIVGSLGILQPDLAKLRYTLASDQDIQMREDLQDQYDSVEDNFTSSDGSGRVEDSQIADSAGVSSGLKSSFNTGASAADAFTQMSDSSNFTFFSQAVADELEPSSNISTFALEDDGYVDYLYPHLQSILGGLGSSW